MPSFIRFLQSFNQLLSAGIAITAFSLLLYALSFNLRDRVARTFALILVCVVIVFVGETFASVAGTPKWFEVWLKVQWVGIIFLPPAYLQFSDSLLATTGKPSRGRRSLLIKVAYFFSGIFTITLLLSFLVGPLIEDGKPVPHLQRTTLTWVFAAFYVIAMVWAWINFRRAYQRTVTGTSRRRMGYLIVGALAPALGSYPYLLFGSGIATEFPLFFWLAAVVSNILVSIFLVVMAYGAAFFGVPWPDRVVKRRLFKWIMRGPVTASTALAASTLVRRWGESFFGNTYSAAVPVTMVSTMILMQYSITLLSPVWERWLFYGKDRDNLLLLQNLEERLLSRGDLRQFLEAVLAAVCDRLQVATAFVAVLGNQGLDLMVTVGDENLLPEENQSNELLNIIVDNKSQDKESNLHFFSWGDFMIVPLFQQNTDKNTLLGLLGAISTPNKNPDDEQREALAALSHRAAIALEDRYLQEKVFNSLEDLTPQVELIQNLRAAARYDGTQVLTTPDTELDLGHNDLSKWVKDALSHYWGGPKLTKSPLIELKVVQQVMDDHDGVSTNALRSILKQGIDRVRPEGDRRFTGEWILYNILEMKFMEGRKVREIALRLAMSEADLYRKQRVAIEAVANAIVEMETQAREEES
ncbi:histidine kinase N-terminal 7TM domain-containing protein [Chloroflexota bacterium]